MDSFSDKHLKDKINEALHNSLNSECASSSEETLDSQIEENSMKKSVERIKDIFEKTEAMKEVAKEKNQQIEAQFKDLKEKLSSSSEYLLRIKKSIENLKFSYQKNVFELHHKLDPATCLESYSQLTKEDMAKHMEDIRKKIDELQNRMTTQREKQQCVTESYQQAFDQVVNTLEDIENGSYSSQKFDFNNE